MYRANDNYDELYISNLMHTRGEYIIWSIMGIKLSFKMDVCMAVELTTALVCYIYIYMF